ncbi:hypothetical protein Taro_003524 [Colocasia esculenta]|uniref:Uncharacterized protein n=1 Tax=Colocasia esculenta TaxID=4460 RepID=A0A843TK15_COLES|nr:hypothetical protein [Colocasia esculenta]
MAAEGGAPQSSNNPLSANPAWAHCTIVDMGRRKVQCKFEYNFANTLEKETSKANITRRRQEIQEELSAPPRRSVDEIHLSRGRQTIDLDDDKEEQFRRASQASRRSFAEEDYLRRTSQHLGQGSGHASSGQGSSSAGMSTNIPEVPVDIPRDGHFFNPQYMYRTNGRNENYDNASEVLIGAKNVIKRMLDNEDRAIIACKQIHDYRLQLYHFGTSTAQRAAQILSPDELDDVSLLPEFKTPPAPKRQKKVVGTKVRSKQRGISIVDLETIEEDNDDETPEPSDNLV